MRPYVKAATSLPHVGLARSSQDLANCGHGAKYLYCPSTDRGSYRLRANITNFTECLHGRYLCCCVSLVAHLLSKAPRDPSTLNRLVLQSSMSKQAESHVLIAGHLMIRLSNEIPLAELPGLYHWVSRLGTS